MTRWFVAGCAAYAAVWWWAWDRLPDRVPLHFGPGGRPDRWAGREEALVSFAAIGAVTAAALALSLRCVRRGSWRWVNVPHKQWWAATPQRRARLRRMAGQDVALVGAATMALLAVALGAVVRAAGQAAPALPWWFHLAVGAYLVGMLALARWAWVSRYRPDEGETG